MPKWEGMDKYKGVIHHSSLWPETPVDMKDKRVAVIGAGKFLAVLIRQRQLELINKSYR